MKQTPAKSNILNGWREAKMFYVLSFFAFGALVLYVAFIGKTVFKLVENKQLQSQNIVISTEISKLELESLALNDSISIEKAYSMGFISAKNTEYVAPALVLTQR